MAQVSADVAPEAMASGATAPPCPQRLTLRREIITLERDIAGVAVRINVPTASYQGITLA
jgi:hypothetical protein